MVNTNLKKQIDFSKVVEINEPKSFYVELMNSILKYLENNQKTSFQEIVKYVGGSDRRVLRLLNQMVINNLINFKYPYFEGKIKKSNGNFINISDVRCDKCESMMVDINSNLSMIKLLKYCKNIINNRPAPTFIFDQRPVTAETTVRRVAYMALRGDIQGKRVAILGDDDLTSIALAKTGLCKEIVVFEIDKRMLKYINTISNKDNLHIKTISQDLTKKIPQKYFGYFDTFLTDPTPTPKPITFFTSLGIKLLKKENGAIGYVSLYPSHMERELKFQKSLAKMNVLVTDMIPFFGQYDFVKFTYSGTDLELLKKYANNEQKISFWEYFMRFETTEKTKPVEMHLSALDLLGRATKRVLSDPSKDPVLSDKNTPLFIKKTVIEIKKLMKK